MKDEALRLALEALESCSAGDYSTGHVIHPSYDCKAVEEAIAAIKQALEETPRVSPEPEPVAWMYESVCGKDFATRCDPPSYAKNIRPLYTSTPKRKPLTDQEIWDSVQHGFVGGIGLLSKAVAVARAIEAAHGIKGKA